MELQTIKLAAVINKSRVRRIVRRANGYEIRRRSNDRVAVAHPHARLFIDILKKRISAQNIQLGKAILAVRRRLHFSAEQVREQLLAIAQTENRNAEIENFRINRGRVLIINRIWPAGKHDAARVQAVHFRKRRERGFDFGINAQLAQTPRDELRVLRAEVENENEVVRSHGREE